MNYASFKDLTDDSKTLARMLPREEIGCVVGVPRSGMIPATVIACEFRVPMFAASAETIIPPHIKGAILVVDDSVATGKQMATAVASIALPPGTRIIKAAVYAHHKSARGGLVDFYARIINRPRFFEWNMWVHRKMSRTMLDMDGVICEDPSAPDDDGEAYAEAIRNAKPLHLPARPVAGIATGRLERWRSITEEWLAKHGVNYARLVMSPHATAQERRQARDVPSMKAKAYVDSKAWLFVESEDRQAKRIHEESKRPVLSLAKGIVYRIPDPADADVEDEEPNRV